jgi:hypothetical protein
VADGVFPSSGVYRKGALLPLNLLHHPLVIHHLRTVCITVYGSIIEFIQPIQLRACESYSRPVGSS